MMKRIAFLVLITSVLAVSCGKEVRHFGEIYKHGTVAKYNIFVDDIYNGFATYTFTHEKYKEKTDAIKIVRNAEFKNIIPGVTEDIVTTVNEIWFDKASFKPLFVKFRTDWNGKTSGWQETETEFGDMIAKWTNSMPAGSQSKEVKFFETFYDEDTLSWIFPLFGYEEGKIINFAAFTNRSGHAVQGTIWMGGKNKIKVSNVDYDTFAGSARMNEIQQNLWFDINTGRLVKYMQDSGFLGYSINPSNKPEEYVSPKRTYVEVLDSWTDPQN